MIDSGVKTNVNYIRGSYQVAVLTKSGYWERTSRKSTQRVARVRLSYFCLGFPEHPAARHSCIPLEILLF